MAYEILEKLKKEIEGFESDKSARDVGIVSEVGDGILHITGLEGALAQEILMVEAEDEEIPSLAFNLEENLIGAVILGNPGKVKVGSSVVKTGKVLSLKAGEELLGRVISPLGDPIDGKGVIFSGKGGTDYFLERRAPSVVERESVNTPLHTGIKAIDSMIPIGRGQREVIIGDRQTGKTSIAIDTIINQHLDAYRKMPICIYVAIGQKESKI